MGGLSTSSNFESNGTAAYNLPRLPQHHNAKFLEALLPFLLFSANNSGLSKDYDFSIHHGAFR
jgi:hypothetical protein